MATLAVFHNLPGPAPGPWLAGLLSDATDLQTALTLLPAAGLVGALCLVRAGRHFEAGGAAPAGPA